MWLSWLVKQTFDKGLDEAAVVCRAKDGREFTPFSIEWRDAPGGKYLILCENEEADDA